MTAKRIRHVWTAAETRILIDSYPNTKTMTIAAGLGLSAAQVYDRADRLGLKKSVEHIAAISREASARSLESGKSTRFEKGHKTWNKGIKYDSGGRSAETRFKPGHKGNKIVPIGSERLTKEGYLQRKVTATGYPPRDWVPIHHLIWRDAGNDIPDGFALTFRDGDKKNLAIENLEIVSRADMMRRNGYQNYGPEITKIVQLRGVLTRKINESIRRKSETNKEQ